MTRALMNPHESYIARSVVVALGDAGVVRGHDRCDEIIVDDDTIEASTLNPITSATVRVTLDGIMFEVGVVVRAIGPTEREHG